MTTIAYKEGVIAYDSRVCRGSMIITNAADKRCSKDGVLFFICGHVSDEEELMDAYLNKGSVSKGNDCTAFVVDDGAVWLVGTDNGELFKQPANVDGDAIGSGSPYAFGAMSMGATATEAVEVARARDVFTGGKISTWTKYDD